MAYANMILAGGRGRGLRRALADAGAAGVIVPDLPLEEARRHPRGARDAGLALVPLVAPTTPPERRRDDLRGRPRASSTSVSTVGITGERDGAAGRAARTCVADAEGGGRRARRGRLRHRDPRAGRRRSASIADGVIVGSRLVRAVADAADEQAAVAAVGGVPARGPRAALRAELSLADGDRDRARSGSPPRTRDRRRGRPHAGAEPARRSTSCSAAPIALKAESLQQTGLVQGCAASASSSPRSATECERGVVAGHGRQPRPRAGLGRAAPRGPLRAVRARGRADLEDRARGAASGRQPDALRGHRRRLRRAGEGARRRRAGSPSFIPSTTPR